MGPTIHGSVSEMATTTPAGYTFPALPIDPVDPGTSLLVTGPSLAGLGELCMRLLGTDADGVLVVSADIGGSEAIETYERFNGRFDPGRMGVVDCTEHGGTDGARNVVDVGTPADLTGIGMQFSRLYEELYGAGHTRIRTGIYTLTTILPFVEDIQPVYRFLHSITGRIRSADGLGVCAMDPQTQDTRVLGSLAQAFDGQLELRQDEEGGACELRVRGLPDHDSDWREVDLSY